MFRVVNFGSYQFILKSGGNWIFVIYRRGPRAFQIKIERSIYFMVRSRSGLTEARGAPLLLIDEFFYYM